MPLVPVPDITSQYVDTDTGRPTKDFFNWLRKLKSAAFRNESDFVSAPVPAFSVHKNNSTQVISGSATSPMSWSTAIYNVGGFFVSNVWVPPAGRVALKFAYIADGTITVDAFTNAIITKNGATTAFKITLGTAGGNVAFGLIDIDDNANGTDAYGAAVVVTSGAPVTVRGNIEQTWFMGHWIGP